jgi:Pyridoxamine 5'-phosphate oxidase
MAKLFDCITDDLHSFITQQHMFFVATAPLAAGGHVNLSPKGFDCLRILSPNRVAYLDVTGSGNETAAHLQENGRITIMFCAFAGPPNILRLYGHGTTVLPQDPQWANLSPKFLPIPGARQIIVADLDRIQTSCGMGVPLYEPVAQRTSLVAWAEKKGEAGLQEYQSKNNRVSIDGIPTPLA